MDSPDCLLLLLSYRTKGCEKSPTRRNVTPYPICIKFCMLVEHNYRRKFWLRSVKWFSGGGDRLSPSPIGFIVALTTPSHYRASVWHKRLLSAVYDTQYTTAMHFHLSCRRYTCVPFIFSSAALSLSLDSWQCCIMPSSHQRNKSVSSRRVWRCELRRRRRRTAAET